MGRTMFLKYEAASQALEAQDLLTQFTVASYTSLKKSSREQLHRKVHKCAHPDLYDSPKNRVTLKDVVGIISGRR